MWLYLKYIILGWWNLILDKISDIKYKKEFDERLAICKQCDRMSFGVCKECGCIVAAKTKSEDSACPLKKWAAIKDTLNK